MLSRHDISDAHWQRIEHLLPGQAGGHGGVGNDNRLFLNAIRYLAKTGIAWADLPTCYGKPNSLWQRYNRWCQCGVWSRVAAPNYFRSMLPKHGAGSPMRTVYISFLT